MTFTDAAGIPIKPAGRGCLRVPVLCVARASIDIRPPVHRNRKVRRSSLFLSLTEARHSSVGMAASPGSLGASTRPRLAMHLASYAAGARARAFSLFIRTSSLFFRDKSLFC